MTEIQYPKIECHYCGAEFDGAPSRGGPKKYCSRSCRQRAYEDRNGVKRGRWEPDERTRRWSE